MSKILIIIKVSVFYFFVLSSSKVSSSGFPVVDIASIAQFLTNSLREAQEFVQIYEEAKNRLEALQDQRDHYASMVEGHFTFEDILNDPNLNSFMAFDDFRDLYESTENLNALRNEFSMVSSDPDVQDRYDNELRLFNITEGIYKSTVERSQKMETLLSQFNLATTPSAREDIANAINFEKTQIQNDREMMASITELSQKRRVFQHEEKTRENVRLLFNEGIPRS